MNNKMRVCAFILVVLLFIGIIPSLSIADDFETMNNILIKDKSGKLVQMKIEDYRDRFKNGESDYFEHFNKEKYLEITHLMFGNGDDYSNYQYLKVRGYFIGKLNGKWGEQEFINFGEKENYNDLKNNIYYLSFDEKKPIFTLVYDNKEPEQPEEPEQPKEPTDYIELDKKIGLEKINDFKYELEVDLRIPKEIKSIYINGKDMDVTNSKIYISKDGEDKEVKNYTKDNLKYLPFMPIVDKGRNIANGIKYAGEEFINELEKVNSSNYNNFNRFTTRDIDTNISVFSETENLEEFKGNSKYTMVLVDGCDEYEIDINVLFNNDDFNKKACLPGIDEGNIVDDDLRPGKEPNENLENPTINQCDEGERPYTSLKHLVYGEKRVKMTNLSKEYKENKKLLEVYKENDVKFYIELQKNKDEVTIKSVLDENKEPIEDSEFIKAGTKIKNKDEEVFCQKVNDEVYKIIEDQINGDVIKFSVKIGNKTYKLDGEYRKSYLEKNGVNMSLDLFNEDPIVDSPTLEVFANNQNVTVNFDIIDAQGNNGIAASRLYSCSLEEYNESSSCPLLDESNNYRTMSHKFIIPDYYGIENLRLEIKFNTYFPKQ